ncbi:MAG: hypothetical protein WBG02_03115 [Candidatus Acidiferrum sp.]
MFLKNGVHETALGSAQQKKKLARPKKNVEQPSALQIIDLFAVQGDIERPSRALFDKCAQRRKFEWQAPDLLRAWIDALQILVAQIDEMVQAKVLLSQ